jgi:hypothetical protein
MALTRVACDEEGKDDSGKSDGDEGGGRATATRAMATEGKQKSTSGGIDKGGRWLAGEHRQGNHTTTTVGDNKQQEHAAVMAAMKRARVDRVMVMEMRVVGDEEGEGNDKKDDVGDEGGVR